MTTTGIPNGSQFDSLKAKHRLIRASHSQDLALRIHRALSWLERAEIAGRLEPQDADSVFLFHWISFNAAYAEETPESYDSDERSAFQDYFARIIELDSDSLIFNAIWEQFAGPIRMLLDNRYVFQPFWKHHNGAAGYDDWERRFEASKSKIRSALGMQDTVTILSTLFDRLYVLRNQLLHGGATWNSSVNRQQVEDGARIMAFLAPVFIEIMMNNPQMDWGKPYYPVVN
ncbi:MAG: HEPN domain-containing protein [Chloroflexi bacterium]|nr:HEPN domain-containing protein [Chloroflexota bacterium]